MLLRKRDRSAIGAESQEDVSREAIVTAFRGAMIGHLCSHVPGTSINERTLLASDFLNQFHELVMLLEALAVQPDAFIGDLRQWHPVGYEEHFSTSGIRDKELAIAAYRMAPKRVRAKFDTAVARLQGEALRLVATVGHALDGHQDLKTACDGAATRLRVLIDSANAIANGFAPEEHEEAETEADVRNQLTINTLFQPR